MPIPFSCPHCGKSVVVEDHFAGQAGPCASCGRPITVPAPIGAPGTSVGAGAVGVLGVVLGIGAAILMLCVGLGGLIYALLIPDVAGARQAAQRTASMNNLKQITLALHSYEADNGSFPPAYVTDAAGKPLYSWRVLILPYLGEDALFQQFDKTKSWDDPVNLAVSNAMIDVFRSPSDETVAKNGTSYVAIVDPNAVIATGAGRKRSEIVDGTSNTIMLVEVKDHADSWAAPHDPTIAQFGAGVIFGPGVGQLRAAQPNDSVLVGLADGQVRVLDSATAARVIQPAAIIVNDGQYTPIP